MSGRGEPALRGCAAPAADPAAAWACQLRKTLRLAGLRKAAAALPRWFARSSFVKALAAE